MKIWLDMNFEWYVIVGNIVSRLRRKISFFKSVDELNSFQANLIRHEIIKKRSPWKYWLLRKNWKDFLYLWVLLSTKNKKI